uniref:Uncharacterized protein n=1 Tax=viral metagenome TaxID=1070528 RepID=A0A6C0KW47_9ZZZZ
MNDILLWLLILAIFIFAAAVLTTPNREGLSTTDIVDSEKPISTSKGGETEKFKYFKMLPEDNKWSQETLSAVIAKYQEIKDSKDPDKSNGIIDDPSQFQKWSTEEEAKIFAKTGAWPLNDYIKSNLKKVVYSDPNNKTDDDKKKNYEKIISGGFGLYNSPSSFLLFQPVFGRAFVVNGIDPSKPEENKGQPTFMIDSLNGIKVDDTNTFKCTSDKPYFNETEITEYNDILKVPGFKFLKDPCNPCINSCPFSYEDVSLPSYDVYWGISSKTGKSNPASVPDDKQTKVCLSRANKKIIDMGGEPEPCP